MSGLVQSLGWEHTRSHVYLQWLQVDDTAKVIVERVTVPIKELNDREWLNVESVSYQNNQFILFYTVRGDRDIKRTTVLRPSIPGEYSIEK
jgi:hypothetical protein